VRGEGFEPTENVFISKMKNPSLLLNGVRQIRIKYYSMNQQKKGEIMILVNYY